MVCPKNRLILCAEMEVSSYRYQKAGVNWKGKWKSCLKIRGLMMFLHEISRNLRDSPLSCLRCLILLWLI